MFAPRSSWNMNTGQPQTLAASSEVTSIWVTLTWVSIKPQPYRSDRVIRLLNLLEEGVLLYFVLIFPAPGV